MLLDEIEKAHPSIWNAFLQVFDAGRLSDARGNVADFSRAVIVMTSTLGATEFGKTSFGFGTADENLAEESRVIDTIRQTMRPELVNRIDEVVVFKPLLTDAIERIAHKEVDDAIDRLADRGYRLRVDDDVVSYLARTGYDKAYGARHLQRNIERLLLQPLVQVEGRNLRAELEEDAIVWRHEENATGG